MQIGKRKIGTVSVVLLVALLCVSAVLGAILYNLTIPATWKVNVAQGLELDYANGTKVTALTWIVNHLGSETQDFLLKNIGNNDGVNVTQVMPGNTSLYQFSTDFVNETIPQGGSPGFEITLTDLGMDSTQTYSGNFAWNIVDHFDLANETQPITWATTVSDVDAGNYVTISNFAVYGALNTGEAGRVNFTLTWTHNEGAYGYISYRLEIVELGLNIGEQHDIYLSKYIPVYFSVPINPLTTGGALTMRLTLFGRHN